MVRKTSLFAMLLLGLLSVNAFSQTLPQYDFDEEHSLEHRFAIRRHGHDFNFELGFEHDGGDGDTSITFTIYPSFLLRGRAERGLGAGRNSRPNLIAPQY